MLGIENVANPRAAGRLTWGPCDVLGLPLVVGHVGLNKAPVAQKGCISCIECIMSIGASLINHLGADRVIDEAIRRVVMHSQTRGCRTWVVINGCEKTICVVA